MKSRKKLWLLLFFSICVIAASFTACGGGKALASDEALKADYSSWENVTIPHTWNGLDAEEGGGNYERTACWYHKEFELEENIEGKRIYVEFLGSNIRTEVYVNGEKVRDVHISPDDNGSSGLFLTTGNIRSKEAPKDLGEFQVKADFVNGSDKEKTAEAVVTVKGDNAPKPITEKVTVPAGGTYPLRGVNRHSYLAGVGSAMTEEQHKADMDIMLELGVNTVRLCHYPQTDYFYDLCDEKGIVVWTEIPLVNMIGSAAGFEDNAKQQLTVR